MKVEFAISIPEVGDAAATLIMEEGINFLAVFASSETVRCDPMYGCWLRDAFTAANPAHPIVIYEECEGVRDVQIFPAPVGEETENQIH